MEGANASILDSKVDAIAFEDVSIAFNGNQVLDRISFRLARGETKAIFGVAGAGKSTILKPFVVFPFHPFDICTPARASGARVSKVYG